MPTQRQRRGEVAIADGAQRPVRGRGVPLPAGRDSQATVAPEAAQKRSGASALEDHLLRSMRAAGLPEPEREYRFHATRKWRLDFAFVEQRLGVEVEGGIYRGGGHTHVKDLKRDMEKSNALTLAGWRLLRFHGDQVRSGEATDVIRQALAPATGGTSGRGAEEEA